MGLRPPPLPSPTELGLPEKFQRFYDDQLTAIDKVVLSTKRFVGLAVPTGGGKSLIGVTAALLHGDVKRAVYLTSTKGLQDQASVDFSTIGMVDVRGQRNYPCRAVQPGEPLEKFRRSRFHVGCDEGPCHAGVECRDAPAKAGNGRRLSMASIVRPRCEYFGAVWDAWRAPLVITNYAMWLAATEYAEGLGEVDLLILDEAHDADKELESFLTMEVSLEDAKAISAKLLTHGETATWREWARHHVPKLAARIESLELHPPTDVTGVRDLRQLKGVHGKLERLAKIDPLAWIGDVDPLRAKFAPTQVSAYAEAFLFRGVKHVVLMSATMTRKTTQLLGIPADDLHFWECPSRFPPERRPIISVNTTPAVRVNARMTADDKFMWLRRIDRIIEPRRLLGWKGIIHTVSYARMKELLASSEHRDVMLVHDSANTREAIQQFKRATKPMILVSPSIVTGYDFPDDCCRYSIIAKVPIPDMRGPIMTVRGELDKDYSGYLAMQKLVQACGRHVRGPLDWGETLLVDDTFADWFLNKYRRHAPRWFHDAIVYTDHFPEPMDVNILTPVSTR